MLQVQTTQQEHWQQLAPSGRLFAIVDSCRQPLVRKKAVELGRQRAVSLYEWGCEPEFEHVGPFLFHLDAAAFQWIALTLSNSPWGIFASAPVPMQPLLYHFSSLLRVKDTDRQEYLFRFYDPRILTAALESSDDRELARLFGPVEAYGAPKNGAVSSFRMNPPVRAKTLPADHFQIRADHARAFEAVAVDNFEGRAVTHLRAALPESAKDQTEDQLRLRIREARRRAETHGFRSEQAIMCFVDTSFLLGDKFETDQAHAWTKPFLGAGAEPADQRAVDLLDGAEEASRVSKYR